MSRATVRKIIRSHKTEFKYERGVQPAPKLGKWVDILTEILEREGKLPRRERRSTQRLFEELRGRGYDGAHDSVHRFTKAWRVERARAPSHAFVPLSFAPGEAYQFDWSHETITLRGLPLVIKAAHMKLSHSRMPFVRAYFRETQELVFDAHDKAFAFYGGVCRRGIYDNMKTAVEAIFVGKARQYNRRFLQMCSHHLVEPVACTPASGWEKGQVENQVCNLRDQFFRPKPQVESLVELNAWLEDQCIAYAKGTQHPEFQDRTIWEVFQDEAAAACWRLRGPSRRLRREGGQGHADVPDHGRSQSLHASMCAARCAVIGTRALPFRMHRRVCVDGVVVCRPSAPVSALSDYSIDPWHYLPRSGEEAGRMYAMARCISGFVSLSIRPGPVACQAEEPCPMEITIVEVACRFSITAWRAARCGLRSRVRCRQASPMASQVISYRVFRRADPRLAPSIVAPDTLRLQLEPVADCGRYDSIRKEA